MGLDFSFRQCRDAAKAVALKKKAIRAWYKGPHETYYAIEKLLKDPQASHGEITEVFLPSRRQPNITINSFGSSYGGTSFISSLQAYGLPGYLEIFSPPKGRFHSPWFIPNWDRTLTLTRDALKGMKDRRRRGLHVFQVLVANNVPFLEFSPPSNVRQAMELFEDEWKVNRWNDEKSDISVPYSGRRADFNQRGWTVHGLTSGTYLGKPCVYAIYSDKEIFENHFTTLQMLEEILLYIRREGRQFFFIDWSD